MQDYVLVALRYGDRVLMGSMNTALLAADGTPYPKGFLGGTRNKGERLVQVARRKCYEELSDVPKIKTSRFTQLTQWQVRDFRGNDRTYYLYGATLMTKEFVENPTPKNSEFSDLSWISIPKIPWHKTPPGTFARVEHVLTSWAWSGNN